MPEGQRGMGVAGACHSSEGGYDQGAVGVQLAAGRWNRCVFVLGCAMPGLADLTESMAGEGKREWEGGGVGQQREEEEMRGLGEGSHPWSIVDDEGSQRWSKVGREWRIAFGRLWW